MTDTADRADRNDWRSIVAVLANPESRTVAARIMLGETLADAVSSLPSGRRGRVSRAVEQSGLVDDAGMLRADIFRDILRSAPSERRAGVDRFLRNGRIAGWPAGADDRAELLSWIARTALVSGETLTEREVTERLATVTDDPVTVRRSLVDVGLVTRAADGSRYDLASIPRRRDA